MWFFLRKLDWTILGVVAFLLSLGLIMLFSISSSGGADYFTRQAVAVALGIGILFFVATLDYTHIERYSTFIYFTTLAVLIGVLLFGVTVRGTAGWLSFGFFQIQPVELAKVSLIIFLASFITKKKSELGEWTRLIVSLLLTAGIIFLVLRQPDLGSSLVLMAIWGGMMLASGLRLKQLVVLGLLATMLLGAGWATLDEYQVARIETFLNPELDPKGSGYNVLQAMVAVGSGGVTGKGLGNGSQSQLNFLPEKQTDFIFAVVVEELGLVGALLAISLYGMLLYRIKRIAETARDNFGYLVSVGVFIMILVQVTINVGMNMGLLPVTGLPAPFLSYGGSSLLSLFICLGLLQSIYQRKKGNADYRITLEKSRI
jgi:rod shape determining protein RodA